MLRWRGQIGIVSPDCEVARSNRYCVPGYAVLVLAQLVEIMGGNMPVSVRVGLIALGWVLLLGYALRNR